MNKLERLLDLLAALLDTERALSRHEIGYRMPGGAYSDNDEAFRRTFERDKDELRALGLPLVVETVPGTDPPIDGYRIDRAEYATRVPELDSDELAALHLASNLVRLEGAAADDPFFKLGGVLDEGGVPLAEVPVGTRVQALMRATAERKMVSFHYSGQDRTIEPLRLVFSRGHWYLLGNDRGREASRQFRVDRISGAVKVSLDGFDPPSAIPEVAEDPPWHYGEESPIVVRLLVDALHAPWVVDYLGSMAVVEERGDGSVVVKEEVRNQEAFRSFVLTFLEGAEILDPAEVRSELCSWLEAMV